MCIRDRDRGDGEEREAMPSSCPPSLPIQPLPLCAACHSTKIIALTASVFEETKAAAAAIGCDDFLRKPIQVNTLLLKLAEHLGVRYLYEESASEAPAPQGLVEPLARDRLHIHLAQMPLAWVNQLHQAALRGFDHQILQLIDELSDTHTVLAHALTHWVHNFQFDEILDLTQRFLE
ncbi:hypothetical protein ACN4EK_10820, partial [Pantanalinema rosaneae CENA516]